MFRSVLKVTFRRLAFVADFGTKNFNLKTKFDMKNKTSTKRKTANKNMACNLVLSVVKSKLPNAKTHPHLSTVREAFVINDKYSVLIAHTGKYTHLRVRRLDDRAIPNYQIFQQIKNKLLGENVCAVQVFPKVKDYIDNTNTYHLFTWAGMDCPNLAEMYEYAQF